jgi:hypothetical protein
MKIRKTAHDYWNYTQETQERYLNIRYQFGYLEAGYYLRNVEIFKGLTSLFFSLEVGRIVLETVTKGLRDAKVI